MRDGVERVASTAGVFEAMAMLNDFLGVEKAQGAFAGVPIVSKRLNESQQCTIATTTGKTPTRECPE